MQVKRVRQSVAAEHEHATGKAVQSWLYRQMRDSPQESGHNPVRRSHRLQASNPLL